MKTAIPRNNFSSGLISQQLSGRIDLPVFANGLKVLDNFLINLNGSISKRTGYEFINRSIAESSTEVHYLKFIFNQKQVYLLQFLKEGEGIPTDFAVLLETEDNQLEYYKEEGEIKKFSINMSFQEIKEMKTAQNGDYIYICHKNIHPQLLIRHYDTATNTINFTVESVPIETGTGRQNPFDIDGYPKACAFYQQRLFYVGFSKAINKIWASDVGYYNRFTTNRSARSDILEIDGFNFVLNEIDLPIDWIKATTVGLILGSRQGIAVVKQDSGLISPFNFACNLINKNGANEQEPVIVGTVIIYIENTKQRLRALQYSWDINSFISTNLNIYNPELIQEDIKKICYQQDERELVYVLTENGNLYYLLFSSEEMFFSWGKIKTKYKINDIQTVERYSGGTNLFLFDDERNILRFTDEYRLKPIEEFIDESENEQQLHSNYYNYILRNINNFNYLDISQKKEYKIDISDIHTTIEWDTDPQYISFDSNEEKIISNLLPLNFENTQLQFFNKYNSEEIIILAPLSNKIEKLYNSEYRLKVKIITRREKERTPLINLEDYFYIQKNILDDLPTLYKRELRENRVTIVGDGYYFENIFIESDNTVKLPKGIYIGSFRIGFNYEAKIRTMNLGGMLGDQNTMIAKKNILKFYIRLYNSWGGEVGTDYYKLKKINYQKTEYQRFGEPYTLMEQDIKIGTDDSWQYNKSYWLVSRQPYPMNINSITILQEINQ